MPAFQTLIRHLVNHVAESGADEQSRITLRDIIDTPISPELIPADENGNIKQKTEDLVGPYELHDFLPLLFPAFRFPSCQDLHVGKEGIY